MTDALDLWALLDPSRELSELNAAIGGTPFPPRALDPAVFRATFDALHPGVLNQWSDLDPALQRKLINSTLAGGSYHASAVHFGPGNLIKSSALPAQPDATQAYFSMWVRASDITSFAFFIKHFSNGIDLSTGFNFPTYDIAIDTLNGEIVQGTDDNTFTLNEWQHLCGSIDVAHPKNQSVMQLYRNGVSVLDHALDQDSSSGNTTIPMAGTAFRVPGYDTDEAAGEGAPFDVADYRIGYGLFIDFGVADNLAKFISGGKPVDPAVATLAFGTPGVLLTGDASSFVTNQGSFGDIFTILNTTLRVSAGLNGAGALSVPGAVVGASLLSAHIIGPNTDITADFESTITVTDEIQQTSASDLSADAIIFTLTGSIADASTSPSD